MRAILCALMLALAVWPLAARADDAGPRKDVAAIRHDLPVLLSAQLKERSLDPKGLRIVGVVVDGDSALAELNDFSSEVWIRIAWLRYRYGRWWLDHEIWITDGGAAAICCPGFYTPMDPLGPTPRYLLARGIPGVLVAAAAVHLPTVKAAAAQLTPCPPPSHCLAPPTTHGDGFMMDRLSFGRDAQALATDNMGSYVMHARFAANDAPLQARIETITARAPTEGESWVTPGGNSYFFFSGTVQSTQPVHVEAGTTIDVWFPFVLDPSLRYSLTIAGHGFTAIGPVDGTLADNTLHFVLPAFVAPPGVDMMGEIESD